MTKTFKLALLAAASVSLSGCNSPLLAKLGLVPKRAPVTPTLAEAPPRGAAALALDEGRAQLRAGQIAAAVASFRIARLDAAFAAEANNGLGVAYARLGRSDLAADYFRAAIEQAPGDMRYASNFLRLQREVEVARAAAATRASAPAPRMARADDRAAPAAPPVHRVSDGVVHIRSAPAQAAAPRMAIAYLEQPKAPAAVAEEQDTQGAPAADDATPDAPQQKLIVLNP